MENLEQLKRMLAYEKSMIQKRIKQIEQELGDYDDGKFSPAPIFDQGNFLLTTNQSVNCNEYQVQLWDKNDACLHSRRIHDKMAQKQIKQ